MRGHRNLTDRITIAVFLVALCVPAVAGLLHVGVDKEAAQFEMGYPWPEWSWQPKAMSKYPRMVEGYYNTHFAFRGALMGLHARFKVELLGVSSSDKVTLGKDGWLFYAGEDTLDVYRRVRPYSDDELARWAHTLVSRRDWLRAHGSAFVFFIAPDPQTLYSEYMPDSLIRANNPSRREQLTQYLKSHTDLDVIDLEPALREAKQHERVYYRTDTHWNQLGGFIAYQQVSAWMKQRFAQWRTFTLDDFTRTETPGWHGALSYFLGAPWLFSETRLELHSRTPGHVLTDGAPLPDDETNDAWNRRRRVVRESSDGEVASAVFLRDSQFAAPAQFLSRHFKRSVLLWTNKLDPQVIEEEHPQVVVEEVAERLLMTPVPEDPPLP